MEISALKPWLSLVNEQGQSVDHPWEATDAVQGHRDMCPQLLWLEKGNLPVIAKRLSSVTKYSATEITEVLQDLMECMKENRK